MAISLLADVGNLTQFHFKAKLLIKNDLSKSFSGPFEIGFSDIRDPSIRSLEFPKLLTSDWSENSNDHFYGGKHGDILFLDLDWLSSIKNKATSFLRIFDFKLIVQSEEVLEMAKMILS